MFWTLAFRIWSGTLGAVLTLCIRMQLFWYVPRLKHFPFLQWQGRRFCLLEQLNGHVGLEPASEPGDVITLSLKAVDCRLFWLGSADVVVMDTEHVMQRLLLQNQKFITIARKWKQQQFLPGTGMFWKFVVRTSISGPAC